MTSASSSSSFSRRLQLGSVSSLSLEEEEHERDWLADIHHDHHHDSSDDDGDDGGCHHGDGHAHRLHDLLTACLMEQVEALLVAKGPTAAAVAGLRRALDPAVHAMLRLSEDEPYGVRGANIFVRLLPADAKVGDAAGAVGGETLGSVRVDHGTVSTFNLVLFLQEERPLFSVSALRNWLLGQLGGAGARSKRKHLMISPHFAIKKEKLYRSPSGSTLVDFQF